MTARRRGNSEGSIYFDASVGLYRAAVTLSGGKRKRVSARTRRAVAAKLQSLQAQLAAGLPVGDTSRVGPYLEWWLDTLEAKASSGTKSVNTVDNASGSMRKWVVPTLGTRRLVDLTPEDVETVLARMVAEGKARGTVARVRSYLGQALAVAERRGKVSRNVARLAEMPATPAPIAKRSLTADQAHRLLEAIEGDRFEALWLTGLLLGLRPGELTGLTWRDVDLNAGTLMVSGSMKIERGHLHLGETKNRGSLRPLKLPDRVRDALRAHKRRQAEDRLRVGSSWRPSDLVFTTSVGTAINPNNLRRSFRAITGKAQLPGRWVPNELRHSAATLMYESGVPLEAIADILGHSSTRMLEQHYRHATGRVLDDHVVVMNKMFGNG
jgi:integrase